jgi:hypothetical protein
MAISGKTWLKIGRALAEGLVLFLFLFLLTTERDFRMVIIVMAGAVMVFAGFISLVARAIEWVEKR